MKIANEINFSKKFSKLEDNFFLTVRWTDTRYVLGDVLPIIVNGEKIGEGQVMFTFTITLDKLLDTHGFTFYDADTNPTHYYRMMKEWYSKKPDWKLYHSKVQLVAIRRVN